MATVHRVCWVAFVFLRISSLAVLFFGCCCLNLVWLSTCAFFHQKCESARIQENNNNSSQCLCNVLAEMEEQIIISYVCTFLSTLLDSLAKLILLLVWSGLRLELLSHSVQLQFRYAQALASVPFWLGLWHWAHT